MVIISALYIPVGVTMYACMHACCDNSYKTYKFGSLGVITSVLYIMIPPKHLFDYTSTMKEIQETPTDSLLSYANLSEQICMTILSMAHFPQRLDSSVHLIQKFKWTLKSWEFIVGNSLFHAVFTTLAIFSTN